MDKPDFAGLLTDSSRSLADYAASVVGNDPDLFARLMEIAWLQKPQLSMRAARVADIACEHNPDLVRPHLLAIVKGLPDLREMAVKRVFMHILTRHSWVDDEEAMGCLVDALLRWLMDDAQSIAVKNYSLMILENIAALLPDLKVEIAAIVEESIPFWDSGAMQSAGRRTLRRLKGSSANRKNHKT